LASFSLVLVPVYRRVRVALLATGDELVDLGTQPGPGQVVGSNLVALAAAVRLCGAEPVLIGTARDDRDSHRALVAAGLEADVLVTSAGVSAGDRDLVRPTLSELGAELVFWKVNVRPGGPTAFFVKDTVPVFALPGNPFATLISFEQFVRPALLKMMGYPKVLRRVVRARLSEALPKKPGRTELVSVQVRIEAGRYLVAPFVNDAGTIRKRPLTGNALALLPAEQDACPAGAEVAVQLLDPTLELEE